MKNERSHTQELALLSAYLDGELQTHQRQTLNTRLGAEPDLRERLESLRRVKLTVGYLPRLRAPHNFTLTPEMVSVRSPKKQPFVASLRLATALAAILLVVLFSVEFMFTSGPLARPQMGAERLMEIAMVADEAEPEPLIVWGAPGVGGADPSHFGMGGGAEVMEAPVMVEVEMETAVEEEILPEEILPEEPMLALEAEALPPTEEELEAAQIAADSQKTLPILGINTDEGGEIVSRYADTFTEEAAQPAWRQVVRVLQIALGAILVGGGLAWWIFKRHGLG
jgi:anti-sigma factor RsiW